MVFLEYCADFSKCNLLSMIFYSELLFNIAKFIFISRNTESATKDSCYLHRRPLQDLVTTNRKEKLETY